MSSKASRFVLIGGALILSAATGFFAGNNKTAWYDKLPPAAKQAITQTQTNAQKELEACVKLLENGKIIEARNDYDNVKKLLVNLEQSSPTYNILKAKVNGFEKLLDHVGFALTQLNHQIKMNQVMITELERVKVLTIKDIDTAKERANFMFLSARSLTDMAIAHEHDVNEVFEETHDGKLVHAMCLAFDEILAENLELIKSSQKAIQAKISQDILDNSSDFKILWDHVRRIENHRKALQERANNFK